MGSGVLSLEQFENSSVRLAALICRKETHFSVMGLKWVLKYVVFQRQNAFLSVLHYNRINLNDATQIK